MKETLKSRVAAVVVTRNRPKPLRHCLEALTYQTCPLDSIILVDQSDAPDSQQFAAHFPLLDYICQPNQGASGGYYRGLLRAWERGYDWAWLMDDDVVAAPDALQMLLASPYAARENTGFLASRVVDADGKTYMTPSPAAWCESCNTIAEDLCVRVATATFVGFMVSRQAISRCGLPLKEYFIYDDDIEFSDRISREMDCFCVLTSVVAHHQQPAVPGFGLSIKKIYQARNRASRLATSPSPLAKRYCRLFRHALSVVVEVLQFKSPLRSLWWLLWGVCFFRPQIVYPKSTANGESADRV